MPKPNRTKSAPKKAPRRTIPVPAPDRDSLWEGPAGTGPNGGVTYSLLCRWLTCPERFRLLAVEGWRAPERFVAPIEFGNMWHTCEERHAGIGTRPGISWEEDLGSYVAALTTQFPFDREEIAQWYDKCRALFPLYVEHWSQHDHVVNRTPLLSEQAFDVPYKLPSGRTVRLRGKWDSVDLVDGAVWLQENKTKSTIDTQKITRQMSWDLQTMIYVIALHTRYPSGIGIESEKKPGRMNGDPHPIKGVRYNVVRRSAHKGGRGKSAAQSMLDKFHEDRDAGRVGEWFARWEVEVSPEDMARFRDRCLDPLLERLCLWWDLKNGAPFDDCYRSPLEQFTKAELIDRMSCALHYQHPFGVRNMLDEGGSTDLDEAVTTGSTVGLQRATTLFPELQGAS